MAAKPWLSSFPKKIHPSETKEYVDDDAAGPTALSVQCRVGFAGHPRRVCTAVGSTCQAEVERSRRCGADVDICDFTQYTHCTTS